MEGASFRVRLERDDSGNLQGGERIMKKNYERPAIVHTEKLEARAISCAKADDNTCAGAPIQS